MYDASKTYTLALEISAVLMFGGALLLLTLGRYQRFDENTP